MKSERINTFKFHCTIYCTWKFDSEAQSLMEIRLKYSARRYARYGHYNKHKFLYVHLVDPPNEAYL